MTHPVDDAADRPVNAVSGSRARQIVELVARGEALSRSDVARVLAIAPSTASVRVQELVDAGILRETGEGPSSGGRRPRRLSLGGTHQRVLAAELGGEHARLGVLDLGGRLWQTKTIPITISDGPEATLDLVEAGLRSLADNVNIRAVGIALPGPVHFETGDVDQPSRMPGWPGFQVGAALRDRFGVPAVVDNDANLMALGEHYRSLDRGQHSITVKAGTAIGSGIIVAGSVHRGATAAAGDITHTRIAEAADIPCSCGNYGCLETIASGAGLVRQMRERGVDVSGAADVLERARNGDPISTALVRTAGTHLGQVLAGVVNFFNPHAVFLTGSMSASEPFVAAVRSRVYEGCHPLVTQTLRIEPAQTGPDAALYGAARLALEHVDPAA
jgi:predicted NBD/HSP70 family sugar kinase